MPHATGKPSGQLSSLWFHSLLSCPAELMSFLFFPFVLLWIILVMQVERWKTSTATQKHPFPMSCAVHPGGYELWRCSQKQISVFQNFHELYLDGNCFTCGCGVISVFTGSSLWFYCSLNWKCLYFSNHSREKWSSLYYLLFFSQRQGRVVICFPTKSLSQFIMKVLDQNVFWKSLKVL